MTELLTAGLPPHPLPRVAGGTAHPRRRVTPLRTTMDAVGYVRVSTNEKKQLSIPGQMQLIEKRATQDGRRIVRWYKDERSRGVRRQGLRDMLADLPDLTGVGAVYIWEDKRLWGHVEQQRFILARCRAAGVRVFDASGREWKSDTPLDVAMNAMSAVFSELETGTTSGRVYGQTKQRVEGGQLVTRPTYAVRVRKVAVDVVGPDGETDVTLRSVWEVDADRMRIVRRAFVLADAGLSTRKIAETFISEGVDPTKSWSVTTVGRILDTQFYIGEQVWNRRQTAWEIDPETGDKLRVIKHRAREELVVSRSPLGCILAEDPTNKDQAAEANELFWRVQERLRNKTGRERLARKHPQRVLYGLVTCGRCGRRMVANRMSHKSRITGERSNKYVWLCVRRVEGGACPISHAYSESLVYSRLAEWLDGRGSGFVRLTRATEKRGERGNQLARLRAAVASRAAVVDKLHAQNALPEEECPFDSHEEFMDRLRPAKEALRQAKADLTAAEEEGQEQAPELVLSGDVRTFVLRMIEAFQKDSIPLDARQQVARLLIAEVRLDNPRIEVRLRWDRLRHAAREAQRLLSPTPAGPS